MKESQSGKRRDLTGSRFEKGLHESMQRLNSSIEFDRRLYAEDIEASKAWAEALSLSGIIPKEDAQRILEGLDKVLDEIQEGRLAFRDELEDIHMHVESRLTELIGSAGERLHTGRSRNDQVATDLRLYVRREAREVAKLIGALVSTIADLAEREIEVIVPAYTHLQRALPVHLSHHLLAYAEMLLRDRERFLWAADQADSCPLGSGACAGNQFGVNRELLKGRLGFSRLTHNSMDAVSDRDFACDFLHASTMLLVHVSRLSEDVILWSSAEFGLVVLDDSVSTGSSMLPQKRNPDPCELGRGKCGRVLGDYVGLIAVLKGLPLSYNRDLQEDKEGVFDAVDTVRLLLPVFQTLLETIRVRPDRAKSLLEGGYLDALGVADYLTRKGVPFREAHRVAGAAVRRAEALGVGLTQLTLQEYRALHSAFSQDLHGSLSVEGAVRDKDVIGGTATPRVREEIGRIRKLLQPGR